MCITFSDIELQGGLLVCLFQKITCYTLQNKTIPQGDHEVCSCGISWKIASVEDFPGG